MTLRTHDEYVGQTATPDADGLAVLQRDLKEDLFATSHLLESLKKEGKVDRQLAYSILYMKEARLAEFCKQLGVELDSAQERENRYADLRAANAKVHRLERELGQTGSAKQTAAHLKVMSDKLNYWWDREGFGHIRDISFTQYGGLSASFSCHLFGERALIGSRKPVSDEADHEEWLQELRERGYELVAVRGDREPSLLDCDRNRQLLKDLFGKTFPKATISKTGNQYSHASAGGAALLRDVEVYFHKLEEVDALPMKPDEQ